jgi:hypothetical protein
MPNGHQASKQTRKTSATFLAWEKSFLRRMSVPRASYTGSFTPETVDIIRDHPDVSAIPPYLADLDTRNLIMVLTNLQVLEVHDKAMDWLKATGQEGRVDHHRDKGDS